MSRKYVLDFILRKTDPSIKEKPEFQAWVSTKRSLEYKDILDSNNKKRW